jgi:excinuclease UvrABC nuclease subunit
MLRSELPTFELPDHPGVYLFTQGKGRGKKILYVGKATSLRDRVRSYLTLLQRVVRALWTWLQRPMA